MKFNLTIPFIIFCLLFLVSCHVFFQQDDRPIETKMAFKMAREIIEDIQEDDDLYFCGISEAGPQKKYTKIGLKFCSSKILSKEEGRRLILKCLHKMLEKFNGNVEFSQYIQNGKFAACDLGVSIYIRPEGDSDAYHPDIMTFSFFSGNLWYFTKIPNISAYYKEEKESYEDALRLVDGISTS